MGTAEGASGRKGVEMDVFEMGARVVGSLEKDAQQRKEMPHTLIDYLLTQP